jgi:hypothetical protein
MEWLIAAVVIIAGWWIGAAICNVAEEIHEFTAVIERIVWEDDE